MALDPTQPVSRWAQPGLMIQWRLPQEPVCRTQADCAVDGGNTTCGADPISVVGTRRCFCNSPLRWDGINGVCAEGESPLTLVLISLMAATYIAQLSDSE